AHHELGLAGGHDLRLVAVEVHGVLLGDWREALATNRHRVAPRTARWRQLVDARWRGDRARDPLLARLSRVALLARRPLLARRAVLPTVSTRPGFSLRSLGAIRPGGTRLASRACRTRLARTAHEDGE